MTGRLVGVDVGARRLHCAAIDESATLVDQALLPADDPDPLTDWCAGAAVVAIDAPETPSRAPHADDPGLAPKFRAARCGEIELGRRHGIWVSWVAPGEPPFPAWMESGFRAFAALRGSAAELIEVYPYGGFRELAGGQPLASKRSASGRRQRAELLGRAGLTGDRVEQLAHDLIDALMAALIARDRARGRARRVTCGHDGSAIWLPGGPVATRDPAAPAESRRRARAAS